MYRTARVVFSTLGVEETQRSNNSMHEIDLCHLWQETYIPPSAYICASRNTLLPAILYRVFFSPFGPKLKRQKTQEITITQGFFLKTQLFFPKNSNFEGKRLNFDKNFSSFDQNSRIFFRNSSFFPQNSIFRQIHLTYLPMNG